MQSTGVPKLVTQKSAIVTSELEVTIWSGTFQTLRLVLVFAFKPPDGIPLVQSCLGNPARPARWLVGLDVLER